MLKRQQAEAVVSARKTIVEGAVEISYGAVTELESRGVKLAPEEKAKMGTETTHSPIAGI